jgi:hypothetical protein
MHYRTTAVDRRELACHVPTWFCIRLFIIIGALQRDFSSTSTILFLPGKLLLSGIRDGTCS